jgi:hypothetical protein
MKKTGHEKSRDTVPLSPPEGVDEVLDLVELSGDINLTDHHKARLTSRGKVHALNKTFPCIFKMTYSSNCLCLRFYSIIRLFMIILFIR